MWYESLTTYTCMLRSNEGLLISAPTTSMRLCEYFLALISEAISACRTSICYGDEKRILVFFVDINDRDRLSNCQDFRRWRSNEGPLCCLYKPFGGIVEALHASQRILDGLLLIQEYPIFQADLILILRSICRWFCHVLPLLPRTLCRILHHAVSALLQNWWIHCCCKRAHALDPHFLLLDLLIVRPDVQWSQASVLATWSDW